MRRKEPTQGHKDYKDHKELLNSNKSKMIQGGKIVELRIELLVDAISKCHMAVATRKSWKDIKASMDAVEITWDRMKRTSWEGGNDLLLHQDLPMMVERVLTKATKYLAKAQAKMEKWWEAQVQAWEAEKASEQPRDDEDRGKELNAEVNEVAPELSAVNKVNEVELEVSNVNKVNEVNVSEVNVCEVNVNMNKVNELNDESTVNKVNEECTMNEDSGEVCDAKEEMRKGKPPEVPQRFDFDAKVHAEDGKEVGRLPPLKEVKEESRNANWDPGELIDTKALVEIMDAKEVEMLVNDDKVRLRLSKKEARLRGDVNANALFDAMLLFNFMRLYISEVLVPVARNAARFVNVNPMSSRTFGESILPILSDYG